MEIVRDRELTECAMLYGCAQRIPSECTIHGMDSVAFAAFPSE